MRLQVPKLMDSSESSSKVSEEDRIEWQEEEEGVSDYIEEKMILVPRKQTNLMLELRKGMS